MLLLLMMGLEETTSRASIRAAILRIMKEFVKKENFPIIRRNYNLQFVFSE